MSGVLRLGNTGAGTGRSTLEASASNDQTFTLPSAGGTILTTNFDTIGTITWNGSNINITNADLNVNGGQLFIDESTGNVQVGNILLVSTSTDSVGIGTTTIEARLHIAEDNTNPIDTLSSDVNRILLEDSSGSTTAGSGAAIDFEGVYGGLGRVAISKTNSAVSGTNRDNATFRLFLNQNLAQDSYAALQEVINISSAGTEQGLMYSFRGSEQLRIDNTGNLLLNLSIARDQFFNGAGVPIRLQVEGSDSFEAAQAITRNDDTADAPSLVFAKSRSTAYDLLQYVNGSNNSDDRIGRISFQGADTTKFVYGAQIEAYTDGTPGANDMPARLVFSTTPDGGNNSAERLRISSTGACDFNGGISNFDNLKKPAGIYNKTSESPAYIHQGANRYGDVNSFYFNQPSSGDQAEFDLIKVTGWQSSNSRIFVIVNWMFVTPIGYAGNNPRGAGYTDAFARYNNAGLSIGSTQITVPLVGGAVASGLRWEIDASNDLILKYVANQGTATQMAYVGHKVRVEWVAKDGAYVRYATGNG